MCEGKLIVEPVPSAAKLYHPPCTLCGEQGRDQKRGRTHRFRTSESETAQRHPLCDYCLGRVRASCDFLGFLRMIKDGYWRTDGSQAEALAWEESVRLRERMFWSRIGGGVVPAFLRAREDTPRSSVEEEKTASTFVDSQTSLGSQDAKPEKPSPLAQETRLDEPEPIAQDAKPDSPAPPITEPKVEQPPLDKLDSRQASGDRFALNRIQPRPRELSGTETSGKGSIAKRAAMFEKTMSQEAASNQLQANLNDSIRARSPGKGRSPSSAVTVDTIGKPHQESPGTVPGSFDF